MAGPRVDEEPDNVFHVSTRINSTWGGNLMDMVRCARYLEIIDEDKLVENARASASGCCAASRRSSTRPAASSRARAGSG